ncbi:MAG: restriction endonuclease subunit S [Desulfoprunum sp.]
MKFLVAVNMGQSPSSEDCNQDGFGLPFLQGNAEFGKLWPIAVNYCHIPRKIADPGDLLLSVRAPVGALNIADQVYGIGRGLCSLRVFDILSRSYLWWLIPILKTELDTVSTGSTFEAVSVEQVRNVEIYLPCSTSEQETIAKFLDYEIAKIDALISKQQQLIALLKEKRQAVISHAVTKGLNPDAPMNDSGIEWLGEVPAHWEALKIRYVAKLESGHTPSRRVSEYWENCTIPWVTLTDVWQLRSGKQIYISMTNEKVSQIGLNNSSARLLPSGTVILSRTASVGFCGIMKGCMATSQDFANWICPENKILPEYLYFSLLAMKGEFQRLMMGSTHKTIYMPDISELKCALPPFGEQRTIVDNLLDRIGHFDIAEEKADQAIALLKERRTALISAAVTGKIDVRDWQPPPSNPTPSKDTP